MPTTPPTRPTGPAQIESPQIEPPRKDAELLAFARIVTAAQVDRAVLQLRERRGQTAVEQLQAILRALDLTVQEPAAPEPIG